MDRPDLTLAKAIGRLAPIEQALTEGRWQLSVETMSTVLRHTVGILTALQSAVIADAQASS